MSEANSPFYHQGLPEPPVPDQSPDLVWQDFPMNAVEGFSSNQSPSDATDEFHQAALEEVQALQALDLLDGAHLDELERQLFEDQVMDESALAGAIAPDFAAELNRQVGASTQSHQTNVSDLISLIQELNQCNSILLDRVSQLEEALDRSETVLQSELGRSLQGQPQDLVSTSELLNAQERIKHLANQLEFANQTNQRQQILIETLTNQLESNQERLAELEREAALLQQRFEIQSHLLTQSETTCRDLRARLQRQQRYTLQYKAALEKCLEVPPPNYEPAEVASPTPETLEADAFLPKAQRIRPWSAQPQDPEPFPVATADDFISGDRATASKLKLSPVTETEAMATAELTAELTSASISLPSQPESAIAASATEPEPAKPIISYQIHAAEHRKAEALDPAEPAAPIAQTVSDAPDVAVSQATPTSAASSNLNEDGFWQDLARLIDVSADDVVKASVAGNFDEFAAKAIVESTQASERAESEQPAAAPPSTAVAMDAPAKPAPNPTQPPAKPTARSLNLPAPATRSIAAQEGGSGQQPSAILTTHPSWPSPVVYPLRPTKKRDSLAAVDLPSFPRSGSQV